MVIITFCISLSLLVLQSIIFHSYDRGKKNYSLLNEDVFFPIFPFKNIMVGLEIDLYLSRWVLELKTLGIYIIGVIANFMLF